MNKYRIKINTLNNGDKEYIPQVGIPGVSVFGKPIYFEWFNVLGDYRNASQGTTHFFRTEEEANHTIIEYRKHLDTEEGKKVNKTYYKEIKDE